MRCLNCNARNPSTARYCRRCGSVTTVGALSAHTADNMRVQAGQAVVTSGHGVIASFAKWVGYLVIGLVVLSIVLG